MGAADAVIKEFMSDKQNFADAFNQGLFGERVIEADKLQQLNPDVAAAFFRDGGNRILREIERTLDDAQIAEAVMRDDKAAYLLLGMQYQMDVHYAMPVRDMLEGSLLYARQVREIGERKRKLAAAEKLGKGGVGIAEEADETEAAESQSRKEDGNEHGKGGAAPRNSEAKDPPPKFRNSGEFLSGMGAEDKLYPVIILVLYLGNDPWDAPRDLWGMLTPIDERLRRFCPNHQINLVTPEELAALDRSTEFGKAMYALAKGHESKKALTDLTEEKEFEAVQPGTVRLLNTLLKTNIPISGQEGGSVNMCKAMREITEEIQGYQEALAERDSLLAERDSQLANQAQQIEMLKKLVAEYQRANPKS